MIRNKLIEFSAALLLLCGLSGMVGAQTLGGGSVEMDAAAYRVDKGKCAIEVSYGVLYRTLNFTQDRSDWVAPLNATVEALQGGKLIGTQSINQDVRFTGTKAQLDEAGATKVVGTIPVVISYAPGISVRLIWRYRSPAGEMATDTIPKAKPLEIDLPDSTASSFVLSSVELASDIVSSTKAGTANDKFGYTVTPNPSSIFGDAYTKLYYYTELYVPANAVSEASSVEVTSMIQDGVGHTLLTSKHGQPLLGGLIPLFGSMDVDGLPEDSYNLIVIVSRGDENLVQIKKPFYYESGMKLSEEAPSAAVSEGTDEQSVFLNSEISRMSDAQLDEGFAYAEYIAKPEEVTAYRAIKELAAKRKYFFDFWRKRDQLNEKPLTFYQIYRARTDEANKTYTYQKTPGWKSARGRVLMTYGKPRQIYSRLFSVDAKPFIVWEYDNRSILVNPVPNEETGGLTFSNTLPHFVFLDRQGGGKFVLVHSNVQGETSEPGWYSSEAKVAN